MAPTQEAPQEHINRFGKLYFIDDIIRQRGKDEEQVPILGYPITDGTTLEYEYFTGKQLDVMTDEACWVLLRGGFKVVSIDVQLVFISQRLSLDRMRARQWHYTPHLTSPSLSPFSLCSA